MVNYQPWPMTAVAGGNLWSPAPQPNDDDDDDTHSTSLVTNITPVVSDCGSLRTTKNFCGQPEIIQPGCP